MRKLTLIMAAAACLTVGTAVTASFTPAESATLSVRIGDRDSDRDDYRGRHWSNGRWYSDSWWRAHHSYARDCRIVTVRKKLGNGHIVIRRERRCY